MKKVYIPKIFLSVFVVLYHVQLCASVTFGSKDSTVNVTSGSRFNNSSANLVIDGTLQQEQGANISGNTMLFSQGVLYSAGLEALMDGTYDPVGADFVRLEGNGRFRAEPGTLLQGLTVDGVNNSIEGQPLFSSPLVMNDAATELAVAMQNRLNQNLVLNGGTLTLNDDLNLADEVRLVGDGRVELNNRQLRFGSVYAAPWANSLYFHDAADVQLNCKVSLTGTWTFGGVSCLNGNGGVLDLSSGGQLIIDNDSSLSINNIFITGLGDNAGKIIMRNGASIVRTANSTYKLNSDVTTGQGTVYVCGPTTFQIGDKDWTFNGNAHLTVDGTTLWLDPLDSPCFTGVINAPLPLFTANGWNHANLLADLASGTLSLIHRGSIKEVVDSDQLGITPADCITSMDISGNIDLEKCICLGHDERFNFTGDTCLNGNGVEVSFTNQPFSQFIIRKGITVLIKNVTVRHINDRTFDLRDNSLLQIGEDVIWNLETDMTFSSNAVIQVVDGTDDCIVTSGDCNIFTIRGESCRRTFNIEPLHSLLPNGNPRKAFNLGHNSILLENAAISGFDYISFFNDDSCAAAIALACNAAADIDSNYPDQQGNLGTAINFFVEGINNRLILRKDGLVLSGNISFGDLPDNELLIEFNLSTLLNQFTPLRNGVRDEFPFLVFSGDPGVFLFSELGLAQLDFVDFNAAARNQNSNAFVVDDNSLLTYKRLQILDNPIKQQSALFRFEGLELFDQRIDPSFIRSFRGPHKNFLMTAAHIARQKERDAFMVARQQVQDELEEHGLIPNQLKPAHSAGLKNKKAKKKRPHNRTNQVRCGIFSDDDDDECEEEDTIVTRTLSLPVFDQTYVDQVINATVPVIGNIDYNRVQLTNFTVDSAQAMNIRIQNGTVITLGADVVLTSDHTINVEGDGNVIRLPHNMTIGLDNILLAPGAELTFEFTSETPPTAVLTIADNTTLDIEPGSIIRFRGPGTALVGNNVLFNFKGVKTVNPVTKVETVSSRGHIIISDEAVLSMAQNASARLLGVGMVQVSDAGHIHINNPGTLIFGSDQAALTTAGCGTIPNDEFNDIIFDVENSALVRLGHNVPNAQPARISFRHLASTINITSGGMLFIESNGVFEINLDGQIRRPGRLKSLSLLGGLLSIYDSGIFALGSNRLNLGAGASVPATGKPFTFAYDGRSSVIQGNGLVQFVDSAGFIAQLLPNAAARSAIPQQTSEQLAKSLVSKN